MTPSEQRLVGRLQHAVRKLAQWDGYDLADLVEDGYLEPGDLDPNPNLKGTV